MRYINNKNGCKYLSNYGVSYFDIFDFFFQNMQKFHLDTNIIIGQSFCTFLYFDIHYINHKINHLENRLLSLFRTFWNDKRYIPHYQTLFSSKQKYYHMLITKKKLPHAHNKKTTTCS